jgi:SAM-dependent methyltransferase
MDLTLSRPHQARLDFVEGLKEFVSTKVMGGVKTDFAAWAEAGGFDEAALRRPGAVAGRLESDPLYQASRALQRLSQEAMWAEVARGLEPRRAELEAAMGVNGGANGEADAPADEGADNGPRLNDALEFPTYFTANDFHLQPGGFWRDPLTGPIYELGVAAYSLHRYGRAGDDMGQALVSVLPAHDIRRWLEIGCGPGYKMYPVCDAFPEAEAHAIDLSPHFVRYAHHRAKAHGKRVQFAQMNAEALDYPAARFDLAFGILLLHEVPEAAIRAIVAEGFRVLDAGGVFAHVDLPGYAHLDPLTAYVMDWDTAHNGEPFWRTFHEIDIEAVYREAGFVDVETRPAHSRLGSAGDYYQGKFDYHVVMGRKP